MDFHIINFGKEKHYREEKERISYPTLLVSSDSGPSCNVPEASPSGPACSRASPVYSYNPDSGRCEMYFGTVCNHPGLYTSIQECEAKCGTRKFVDFALNILLASSRPINCRLMY